MDPSVLQVSPDEAVAVREPLRVAGQGRMPGTIAVVSDGSALTHRGLAGGAGSVEPVLHDRHRRAPLWGSTAPAGARAKLLRLVRMRAAH
jgi:hypothetical protein